jgi:hypothetical protein
VRCVHPGRGPLLCINHFCVGGGGNSGHAPSHRGRPSLNKWRATNPRTGCIVGVPHHGPFRSLRLQRKWLASPTITPKVERACGRATAPPYGIRGSHAFTGFFEDSEAYVVFLGSRFLGLGAAIGETRGLNSVTSRRSRKDGSVSRLPAHARCFVPLPKPESAFLKPAQDAEDVGLPWLLAASSHAEWCCRGWLKGSLGMLGE